jgi:hypothetical protein
MVKDKFKTKVQFLVNARQPENDDREQLDDDLFAYFPEMLDSISGKVFYYTAYSHVGQHSACHTEYAKESRPATPEEYAPLKAELESIGYNLEII